MSTGGRLFGGEITSSCLNFKSALGANYAEYGNYVFGGSGSAEAEAAEAALKS